VPEGSIGRVNANRVILWDDTGSIGYGTDVEMVKDMVQLEYSPQSNGVRDMFMSKDLAP